MIFYIAKSYSNGETICCEITKSAAMATAIRMDYHPDEVEFEVIEMAITTDNIRRLLGDHGGYAKEIHYIKAEMDPNKD